MRGLRTCSLSALKAIFFSFATLTLALGHSDMAHPTACCGRFHKPMQLDLSRINPASFVSVDLPARRAEISPPPPPSSPRLSRGQAELHASYMCPDWPLVQGHLHAESIYDKEHPLYQSIPIMNLELPDPLPEARSTFDFHSESCVSETNSTTQMGSRSQSCSSCSDTETGVSEKGSFVMTAPAPNSQDLDDLLNIRATEWPAYTTFSYPTGRKAHLPSPPRMIESPTMLQPTLRTRQNPNPYANRPGPSAIADPDIGSAPLFSSASHSASRPCTPTTPALPDLNERSFMDFDDSESEIRDKDWSKASSLSRLFDQKRKGHHRRGFGRSLSDVFSSFSCAK